MLSKNGFWDVKIRFLQNAHNSLQMMWDVFENGLWVQRHLIYVIEPFRIASKTFFKIIKIKHEKPTFLHLFTCGFEEAHFA